MGIYSRDYVREERPGGYGGMSGSQWAIKYLVIANIAVFLAQNVDPRVTEWLSLKLAWQQTAQTGSEPAPFISDERLRQPLPERLEIPRDEADARVPPGTSVEFLGQYGDLAAVRWGDRYGFIPAADVRTTFQVDWRHSWQVVWRLLTYGFCHDTHNLWHILFNMLVLWMFGRAVEPILGSREFVAFFLAGVVISGLGHIAFSLVQHSPAGAVGASGGVMAVVFLTAMTFPRAKVLFMLFIPMELWLLALLYAAADLLGLLNPGSGVAHAAHLEGAAFGVAYKYYNWRLLPLWGDATSWLSGWKRPRRNPKVRIFNPVDEPPFSERVDRILEKIHQQGEASLTDDEREVLKEASRRLKQR